MAWWMGALAACRVGWLAETIHINRSVLTSTFLKPASWNVFDRHKSERVKSPVAACISVLRSITDDLGGLAAAAAAVESSEFLSN